MGAWEDGFRAGWEACAESVVMRGGGSRHGYSVGAILSNMEADSARMGLIEDKPKVKRKRRKSAWNKFVKSEMPKMRRKYPRSKPQQLLKKVARKWRTSTKNPNRKRR